MGTIYSVGSKVVHPYYGAGTVTHIQDKGSGDAIQIYYVIRTASRRMQLMVPVDRADGVQLRSVGDVAWLRTTLRESVLACPPEASSDLRQRQEGMRANLKSGSFALIVGVARTLYVQNARRPLGTVDRQLFEQGKELLAGELAIASDVDLPEAMQEVDHILSELLDPAPQTLL